MNTTKLSLDSTFAVAVLVTGLVFGVLPATSSVNTDNVKGSRPSSPALVAGLFLSRPSP